MNGQGTDVVQLSHIPQRVVLHFQQAVHWVALDPQTAANLSEAMARAAYAARFGDTPTTQDKSQITEQVRVRLTKRVELMLRTFEGKARRPDLKVQASQIVEACMKEAM
jgi:hypothetical protein